MPLSQFVDHLKGRIAGGPPLFRFVPYLRPGVRTREGPLAHRGSDTAGMGRERELPLLGQTPRRAPHRGQCVDEVVATVPGLKPLAAVVLAQGDRDAVGKAKLADLTIPRTGTQCAERRSVTALPRPGDPSGSDARTVRGRRRRRTLRSPRPLRTCQ